MLTPEEKQVLNEACNVYVQVASQQMSPEKVNDLVTIIGKIFQKIDTDTFDTTSSKPKGISDEWFESVCEKCDQRSGATCNDKVTEKFPGKCDPILKFEQQKLIDKKELGEHNDA